MVVIQEIWGVNSHIQYVTDRLPTQGYVGLAPAMFHREGPMTIGLHEEMDTALGWMRNCTDAGIVADVQAAVDYLKAQPFVQADRIGVVGFCYGGGVSNGRAVRVPDLAAAVPFYGGQPQVEDVSRIKAPLLLHYASNDTRVNAGWPAYEEALKANGVNYTAYIYEDTNHGFHNDTTPRYDEASDKLDWDRTIRFFNEKLT